MRPHYLIAGLLWIPCAFLLRDLLRRILKRKVPKWYEQRHRDAESVAAAGGFLLALFGVTAVAVAIDLIWPPS